MEVKKQKNANIICYIVQFKHQRCDIFVDLDEPIQLIDRSSNILNVFADEIADDADKIASIISDFQIDETV